MLRLYDNFEDDWACGNAYKVRLLLGYLNEPFERVHMPLGKTRTPTFMAKNPNGRIPVVEWPDGRRLSESNAILFYLAQGTSFVPQDPWLLAKTLQWQNFEQYSHEPYVAVLRWWHRAGLIEKNRALLEEKISGSYHALGVMEAHLAQNAYFGGTVCSIADISLFAFTCVAPEGGIDLDRFPNVQAWLQRTMQLPGHVGILDKGVRLCRGSTANKRFETDRRFLRFSGHPELTVQVINAKTRTQNHIQVQRSIQSHSRETESAARGSVSNHERCKSSS